MFFVDGERDGLWNGFSSSLDAGSLSTTVNPFLFSDDL